MWTDRDGHAVTGRRERPPSKHDQGMERLRDAGDTGETAHADG
jgi:hypothetical protein